MEVESSDDWELSFYSVTHVAANEFLVKPHSPKSKSEAGKLFPVNGSEAQSPTSVSNTPTFRTAASGQTHKQSGANHGGSSFRSRSHSEKESGHTTRPDVHQSLSQMPMHHPNQTHNKEHASQHLLADWEIPRKQDDHKKVDTLFESNVPRHMQHWATIDHGSGLYDFMSPSRLMGKPIVSPREIPQKISTRGKSVITHGPEAGYKPKGQSISLPDLVHSSKRESFNLHPTGGKNSMPENSPMISPLKGRLKPSYVKINYDDIPIPQEKIKPAQAGASKKKPIKSIPAGPIDDEIIKKALKEQFKKYDLNGDGVISRKEAAMLLEQNVVDQSADIKIALDFILSKMDFDQDQKINYQEYERCVLKEPLLRGCFGGSGLQNRS